MFIRKGQIEEIHLIEFLHDSIDSDCAKETFGEVETSVAATDSVIFDLSSVEFVDSSGLGVLVSLLRESRTAGGEVKICGLTRPVRAMFELVRMHKVFDIYNDRNEAVNAFLAARA